MIILTVIEHAFKAGSSFDCAHPFLEESDFNNLDIENNFDLPIIEREPDAFFFEDDLTVKFYSVKVSDEINESTSEEDKQYIIQDIVLVDDLLMDLDADFDYWKECFADIPVGKHVLELSFDPPVGEDASVVFNGSEPYMDHIKGYF